MSTALLMAILWPPASAIISPPLLRLLRIPPSRSLDPVGWPWLAAATTDLFASVLIAEWIPAAVSAAQIGIAIAIWRWRNRRRDRAPKLAGAKSRARLAALVRAAREAAKPRPVLQPVPGGAR